MTEEFLHYLWKYRLLKPGLKLATGEDCEIIDAGTYNKNSGPDFFNARIRIDDTIWAGNIEVHKKSSDWFAHKHHLDKAYDNIILHVVHQNDKTIYRKGSVKLPTLEIRDQYKNEIFDTYIRLMNSRNWIACENMINRVDRLIRHNWLDRLMIERLEEKACDIEGQLLFNHNNWEQTFYEFMARNFGFKVNSLPFDLLAKSLPLKYLGKHKSNKLQIEAMLFGQSGLLKPDPSNPYPQKLRKEYAFLREKYKLIPLDPHIWRFMRMRPSNFPTLRIAQFAGLVFRSTHLFSKIMELDSLKKIKELFDIKVSDYWLNHYTFNKYSSEKNKKIGNIAINLIILNTVIPFLFVYGKNRANQPLIDRSLNFLDQLPGEKNSIIAKWEKLGMSTRSAFHTQALLQLKSNYCDHKKCLQCSIGNYLLKQELE